MTNVRKISILGATGSVGRGAADVILAQRDAFDVQVVTAKRNAAELAELAIKLKARKAVIADADCFETLTEYLGLTDIECACGAEEVARAAAENADITVAAISGMAGMLPVMNAIAQGKAVAIANKEPLAAAGALVMRAAREAGATILPVDSEHNAVFQVFEAENKDAIENITLTASGGPFRTWSAEQMAGATPAQAVAHPNWSMGAKISVDSASMMNKALEIIEAHHLFDMPPEKIKVVVHPQSIVHAMVEYNDGSVLAQLGAPDMRTPLTNAMLWPNRRATPGRRLDWAQLRRLDFEPVDDVRFPSVKLAYECMGEGTWACAALNAANEVAVEAFLNNKIGFTNIYGTVRRIIDELESLPLETLDDIIEYDKDVRRRTEGYMVNKKSFNTKKIK